MSRATRASLEKIGNLVTELNSEEAKHCGDAPFRRPTTLISHKDADEIDHIVLWVNGFTASNAEGEHHAIGVVNKDKSKRTGVILMTTAGFASLTPDEAKARFAYDADGQFIPLVWLKDFYTKLKLLCDKLKVEVSIHGSSFGAQLSLHMLKSLVQADELRMLPLRVSLLAPFLTNTTRTGRDIHILSAVLAPSTWRPFRWISLPFLRMLVSFAVKIGIDPAHNLALDNSHRSIPMLDDVPLSTLLVLSRITQEFEAKIAATEGLHPELRKLVHVILDRGDPKLHPTTAELVANHISDKVVETDAGVHIVDDPTAQPTVIAGLFADRRAGAAQPISVADAIVLILLENRLADPSASADAEITRPGAGAS
jgi:hypothetical protein